MLCSGADKVIHRGALAINLLVIQKSRGTGPPGLVFSSLRPTNLTNFHASMEFVKSSVTCELI